MYAKERRELRDRLYIMQASRCYYCNKPTFIEEFTLDHIKARSKGGAAKRTNFVGACASCNRAKGDLSVTEFKSK